MYKNALVTVSNKKGLVEFLKPLQAQGMRIVSTGGTAKFLKSHQLDVVDIVEQTGFPEVFSGRVKTLHPHVYMALLSREWEKEDQKTLKKYQLESFDLVICNLYPFEEHEGVSEDQELVEWIDIGGPSLLRASAKNFFTITTLCSPEDYPLVQKGSDLKQRKELASKVFGHISRYDARIAQRLKEKPDDHQELSLKFDHFKTLRYGENPHQAARWYKSPHQGGLHQSQILQGKELSFNNLLDFSSALSALNEFKTACCVAIKHNNPCGVACGKDTLSSVTRALEADPMSVFGGVLAVNSPVDEKTAEKIVSLFLEGIIAPDFSQKSKEILKSKKGLRVLKWSDMNQFQFDQQAFKEILGGILIQDRDQKNLKWDSNWKIIGKTPDEKIKEDLVFAWKVVTHLKSNAIAVVKNKQSLGLGMGQVNRVDAVKSSLERMKQFHPQHKEGQVLASDAFFPFPDSIEIIFKAGIRWIIQPGGSVKDDEIIKKIQDLGINMVLTSQRHFKH